MNVDITLLGWECIRCKHRWIPRNERKPTVCPKCKSVYWDTERIRSKNMVEKSHQPSYVLPSPLEERVQIYLTLRKMKLTFEEIQYLISTDIGTWNQQELTKD